MAGAQTHMALAPRFGLPPRALDCLRAITRHVEQHKSSPSYDDLATALGLSSKSGVVRLVTTLEERGYIRKLSHRARSIEIIIGPPDRPATPHTLPDRLENSLLEHCRRTGEKPADVVADAVALFLDQAEADPA